MPKTSFHALKWKWNLFTILTMIQRFVIWTFKFLYKSFMIKKYMLTWHTTNTLTFFSLHLYNFQTKKLIILSPLIIDLWSPKEAFKTSSYSKFIFLKYYLFIYLFSYLSIYLFIYLFICLFIYLQIYHYYRFII